MSDIKSLKSNYTSTISKYSPKNAVFKNSLKAFWVGGSICVLGEALSNLYMFLGFSGPDAGTLSTISLIFLSSFLTAFNVYDKIGNYAGAGSIIPITGFANSMVSAAMEFKKEGYIFGMGTKMFAIAGPVIVYGTLSSVVVGLIYYLV